MKRAHVSPLLLVLTAVISLSCGIGITLAAEDLARVPMSAIEPENISLPQDLMSMALEQILDWLADHPELADNLPEDLINAIRDKIENGEYDLEDLERLLQEHPELAPALEDYINDYLNNLKEEEEGEEPPFNTSSSTMNVDDGTLDPEVNQEELFTVDSSYRGVIHIRTQSYGDYAYGKGSFVEAPKFDDSIYMVSPLLYPGRSFENAGYRAETLTFHLGDRMDYGMPIGDYCGTSYTSGFGETTRFSKSTESRIRRFDCADYTVSFYPSYSPSDAALPSYLEADEEYYYAFARKNYRNVPEELVYTLDWFIELNKWTSKTPAKQIENFFKNYTYEAQAFSPIGDPVQDFLESEEKVGTCTNFASAMTLLCRELGYPARIVGGYCIDAVAGRNSVKANSAHAWVEVYNSGYGWVRYDPTPTSSKEEAQQTGGSHGETGDPAIDPSSMEKEEYDDTLFSFETAYKGDVYLRSASFLDYDPATSFFALDSFEAEDSSLLYASESLGDDWESMGYPITMYMGDRRDTGMVFATYPSTHYALDRVEDYYSLEKEMRPVSDGRFFREDTSTYSYFFSPDYKFLKTIDDDSYYANYAPYYTSLPEGYDILLESFCKSNGISSLNDVTNFFFSQCELDNTPTKEKGDAIEYFLNKSHAGNSSVFAGAYALLARYFGVPARFVSGYKTYSFGYYNRTDVKESDTYYWVETYSKGCGWQKVDPINGMDTRPIGKTKITLSWRNFGEEEYNGELRTPSKEDLEVSAGSLFPGDEIYEVSLPSGFKSQYCFDPALTSLPFGNVKIRNKCGKDVTERYEIIRKFDLNYHITKKTITIKTDDVTLDASTTVSEESLGEPWISEGFLADGDTYTISYPASTLGLHSAGEEFPNNPIITIHNASGEDVTNSCYVITYDYGTVKIVEE